MAIVFFIQVVGLIIFGILGVFDVLLTHTILREGGTEFNPLMRWIYKRNGVQGLAIFKAGVFCLFSSAVFSYAIDLYTLYYINFMLIVVYLLMHRDYVANKKSPQKRAL